MILPGAEIDLGNAYNPTVDARDLVFQYVEDGNDFDGVVEYLNYLVGDFDFDGDVDNADIGLIVGNFTGSGGTGMTYEQGDIDGDGDIDNADIGAVVGAFTGSQASLQASLQAFAIVPEPASFAIFSLGGLLIARRRRD